MSNRNVEVEHDEVAQDNIGTRDGAGTENDPVPKFNAFTDQRAGMDEGQEISSSGE